MDRNQLVDEILARVAAKLADTADKCSSAKKSNILILTEHHGITCHELLEDASIQTCCHPECALKKEYNCDLQDYDAVVIYNLSNDALSKLAGGVCDTPFLCLALKAILLGKKIFIPTEEIELYQYEQTAPKVYYAMMCEKLKLLQACGVTFCKQNELKQLLTDNCQNPVLSKIEPNVKKESKSIRIDKKVITERDLKKIIDDEVNGITINNNSILTDLAKEYLHSRKIEILREPSTGRKQR